MVESNNFLVNKVKNTLKFMSESEKELFLKSKNYQFELFYNYMY